MHKLALLLLVSCAACAGPLRGGRAPADAGAWAEATLAGLTLEEKVGQLVFARSDGSFRGEGDDELRALLDAARAGRIGGVVFFRGAPFETAAIANGLQEVAEIPLLVASDCEWGAAMRVEGATRFPRAMAIGAGGDEGDVELQAEITAREARALGVQLLLNPVLDVNTHPDNPVIDTRSFGEDPERVAALGAVYVRRAQQLGVLTTAKHFPGHGGTAVDSHVRLPVLREDGAALRAVELVPFRAAIEAGVAAVMPAHLAVPGLGGGENVPATLSPEILQSVLREELGFSGLIVSDALDMGGARETVWDGEVAVEAIKAGVDVLLVPPDPLVAYRAILRAVARGELTESRIDASVRRILRAKERVDLHRQRIVALEDLPRVLANPVTAERVETMFRSTLTLVSNREGLLPFPSESPPEVSVVVVAPGRDPDIDPEIFLEELERRAPRVGRAFLASRETSAIESDPPAVTLVASYALRRLTPSVVEALKRRAAAGSAIVHVSFGTPYALTGFDETAALVAAYDPAPEAQRAAAAALFGEIGFSGTLPVSLSAEYPLGSGLAIEARRMQLERTEDPESVGVSSRGLAEAVGVVEEAIDEGATPGAVVLVGRRGKIVLEEALGKLSYDDDAEAVTLDTLYDLASLTKVIVTTTLSMIHVERGLLDLKAPVARYVPEFRGGSKDRVLVEDLLAHSGGLLWWTELFQRFEGRPPAEAKRGYLETIFELPLDYEPRTQTVYSDLGILLLGEILERITGKPLEVQAEEEIFGPLGMSETMYRPPGRLRERIAPTEIDPWRGRLVRGEVHDENAFGLGGVAPHAGLFSTAGSLAPFVQMMLNGGAYDGERLLRADTIARFTSRANLVPGSSRALGWDTPSAPSSSGRFFSDRSYGHTGFTGTSIWVDPERELFVILLTNRVHPTRENPKISELRPAFHDAVMRSLTDVSLP